METTPPGVWRPPGLTPHGRLADPPAGDVLVVVFLRGAADGLNIVVPFGDPAYYRLRPGLAIAPPDASNAPVSARALRLDDRFGFHPALAPLMPAWEAGHLAALHACGSPDESRSHFLAMELMERGLSTPAGPASGWLARLLTERLPSETAGLSGVAWGTSLPRSLAGAGSVSTLQDLSDVRLSASPAGTDPLRQVMGTMYADAEGPLGALGRESLKVVDRLERVSSLDLAEHAYPPTDFGRQLRQTAILLKLQVGLRVVSLDLGGWDTHFAQGGASGWMARLLGELAAGLAAFLADLGPASQGVSVVVMTEFGRRARENSSLGTDHGHGSVMLLLGHKVAGGRVHAAWPGLEDGQLVGPGDLAVTLDYRHVLAELCLRRLGRTSVTDIFPGFTPSPAGLFLD